MPDKQTSQLADTTAERTASKSMHDGVPVWCDCCSCEAEPYWLEAFESPDNDKGATEMSFPRRRESSL